MASSAVAASDSDRSFNLLSEGLKQSGAIRLPKKRGRKGAAQISTSQAPASSALAAYEKLGKALPRYIHLHFGASRILNKGLTLEERNLRPEEGGAPLSAEVLKEEEALVKAFNIVLKFVPDLKHLLPRFRDHAEDQNWSNLVLLVTQTSSQSRSNDTSTLKDKVKYILADANHGVLSPVLNFDNPSKSDRGFNHPQIAKQLCPFKWLQKLQNDPSFRAKLQTGKKPVLATDWPTFVYEDGVEYDKENIEKGLMRGKLLVRTLRCILTGPKTGSKPKIKLDVTCIACKLGITDITGELIAYSACQGRYMLSTAETWDLEDGNFNYILFYDRILALFADPEDEWTQLTLAWWQSQIFPRCNNNTDAQNQGASEPESDSDSEDEDARIARQRASRRRVVAG